MNADAFADLRTRTTTGLALGGVTLAAAWLGGGWFAALMALAASAMVWEYRSIIDAPGGFIGALLVVAVGLAVILTGWTLLRYGLLLLLCGVVIVVVRTRTRIAWTAAGPLWIGVACACVVAIRTDPAYGFEAVLWLFLTVIATDVGGYFGGRLIGGPKLWPRVSPKKTWAGLLTGMGFAALVGALFARWTNGTFVLEVVTVSAIIAVISQGGDLLESMVKRVFGVKDASSLIPGHGGVLDRLDGLMAAALFAAAVTFARGQSIFIW